MSLFQSALDFLAGPGSSGGACRDHNDFVGQIVELGDMKLRIRRVIAEGEVLIRRENSCLLSLNDSCHVCWLAQHASWLTMLA